MKSFIAFVAVLAVCGVVAAGVVDLSDDQDQVAVRERRQAAGANCGAAIFKSVKGCCNVPQVVPEGKKCKKVSPPKKAKKAPKAPAADAAAPASADAPAAKVKRAVAPVAAADNCDSDCALAGFLTASGDLDIDAVTKNFNAKASADWQTAFSAATAECQTKNGAGPASDAGKSKCKAAPAMVVNCIRQALVANCKDVPAAAPATCAADQDKLKGCNMFAAAPSTKRVIKKAPAKEAAAAPAAAAPADGAATDAPADATTKAKKVGKKAMKARN